LCDLVAAADVPRLVDGVLADPSLRAGNVSMSAYWEYLAYIKTGRFDLVLQNIRHYWGWMLDCGFTRFMEDIDPRDSEADRLSFYTRPYAMSLNHGWSGSVAVSCLMRGVLGLQILAPGYSLVQLSPNWTTFEWVTCKLPTPHGAIELHHRQSEGALLTLPSGVTARVQLASGPREFSGPGQFLL